MDAKFCYTCGHILGMHDHINYYDEQTGHPVYYKVYSCPARKWYHEFFCLHPMTKSDAYLDGI